MTLSTRPGDHPELWRCSVHSNRTGLGNPAGALCKETWPVCSSILGSVAFLGFRV